ncbi:DUF4244 domain-containing protein [Kineococcus rubinsiae]|uniref:DUF4244 domain-containing protein n=1 Tax=Kineococcus rubinsiae TaxID=2609562 RepID=UPI001AD8ADF4|nr:DUF4244 domain-containing protein [Kineococcus rubinsiae]
MLHHNDSDTHTDIDIDTDDTEVAPLAQAPGRALVPAGPSARDAGMATAEYAMATLAACGFAGLLIAILRSSEVRQLLLGVIRQALALG